jgi:hypothetical protein
MNTLINIGMIAAYIFAGFALLTIVFFAVKGLVSNIKDAIPSLIGIGVLIVLFLIAFAVSKSGDVSTLFFEKTKTNQAYSKLIGSGLITLYFVIAVIFAAIIYSQVSKLLKR